MNRDQTIKLSVIAVIMFIGILLIFRILFLNIISIKDE